MRIRRAVAPLAGSKQVAAYRNTGPEGECPRTRPLELRTAIPPVEPHERPPQLLLTQTLHRGVEGVLHTCVLDEAAQLLALLADGLVQRDRVGGHTQRLPHPPLVQPRDLRDLVRRRLPPVLLE